MNGSVSITWNKYTRVLECTLESRSIVSDRPMHPSQPGDRSRERPGRGFIRCVEDQEAFITYHSVGGCVHPSQISHLIFAAVLCSAFARSLAADVSIEGTRAGGIATSRLLCQGSLTDRLSEGNGPQNSPLFSRPRAF